MAGNRITLAQPRKNLVGQAAPALSTLQIAPQQPVGTPDNISLQPTGGLDAPAKASADISEQRPETPVQATKMESFIAGAGQMGGQLYNAVRSNIVHEFDPNFNSTPFSNDWFKFNGVGTPEEVKYLAGARNMNDWRERTDRLAELRLNAEVAAANPITSAIGSVLDIDAGLAFIPFVGGAAKVSSTTARLGARAATGAAYAGATAGAYKAFEGDVVRTPEQIFWDTTTMGLAGALAPVLKNTPTPKPPVTPSTVVPPTPVQATTETLAEVTTKWAAAKAAAEQSVRLTNAEIDALPKQGRGAARRALIASKKADAIAKVDNAFQPRLDAARNGTPAPAPTGQPPVPITPIVDSTDVSVERAAQLVMEEINQRPLAGVPEKQVASHYLVAKLQSAADQLRYITKGDNTSVVNKLYSNPAINNGDDVVSVQNVYLNNYRQRLNFIGDALKEAVAKYSGVPSNFRTRINGDYARATKEASAAFQQALHRLDGDVLAYHRANGVVPDDETIRGMLSQYGNHPAIDKMVKDYMDSGIAVRAYDDAYPKGWLEREVTNADGTVATVNGFDDVVRRPTYLNLRHNFDKMYDAVNVRKVATWDEMADFTGRQITRMYPELLQPKNAAGTFVLTERQVGQHFIQTIREPKRGLSDVTATGMNREQITDLLTRTGNLSDKDARIIAEDVYSQMHSKGTSTPKHLRRRIEWNWNESMVTESGYRLSMRDFVDDNLMGNLEDYTRGMAHRNGLADYGIKSEAALVNLLDKYLDDLPKGVDVGDAQLFMKNTVDMMMGRAIEHNPLPRGIRDAQAVADLFLLANSGLYTAIDIVSQMQKVGLLRSLPYFKQGMKAMFNGLKKFSVQEAKDLEDVLTGRMLAGSSFKRFIARYEDNFTVNSAISEAAQYYGQSARFMNLSESLKRFQVGTLAGVYVSNLKNAMKGSVKELDFMRNKLKIDDNLISDIKREYSKHGTDIDSWANDVRIRYEQKVFHDADNLAMNIHTGEVPAFLEHSAVGRIVFPYMRYAFGMTNKVLRRTIHRDGATGLAMLMAVQFPTALLVSGAINVRNGKDPLDNIGIVATRSLTALGGLNYPMEIAMAGGLESGGATAFAPFAKTFKAGKEVVTGGGDGEISIKEVVKNSPLHANVALGYVLMITDDKSK